jgi:hypothetical protein
VYCHNNEHQRQSAPHGSIVLMVPAVRELLVPG